jgi:hypothetical protein
MTYQNAPKGVLAVALPEDNPVPPGRRSMECCSL